MLGGRNPHICVRNFDFFFSFLSLCLFYVCALDVLGYREALTFVVVVRLLQMTRLLLLFGLRSPSLIARNLGHIMPLQYRPEQTLGRCNCTPLDPPSVQFHWTPRTISTVFLFLPTGYLDSCTAEAPRALVVAARFFVCSPWSAWTFTLRRDDLVPPARRFFVLVCVASLRQRVESAVLYSALVIAFVTRCGTS